MDTPLYDRTSKESILAYAERLVGRSLREVLDVLPPAIDFKSNKGGYGTALERHYFGYEPNSRPEPDFAEAGVELKATPLKTVRKNELVAKERLVLGMIDYMTVISEEWDSSSFLRKNSHLLLVFYLHEVGGDPRDYVVKAVRLWDFPPEDLEIIRQDWETIAGKVRAGLAHELSEGDTYYLSACTKASDSTKTRPQPNSTVPAKPRAYSLKASYMNSIIGDGETLRPAVSTELIKKVPFEQAIADKFTPYIGWSAEEIARHLGGTAKPRAKNYHAVITNRVLGLTERDQVAEFEKADIQVKTVRLLPSGRPKEDLPFPAFKYVDLVEQEWETSDLRTQLGKRYFFVLYRLDADGVPRLEGTRFWTMPVSDIEDHARRCFDETVLRVTEDKAEYLPKKSENQAVHVRPHARNRSDTYPTPSGKQVVKKSFWLNGSYIQKQLGLSAKKK